MSATTLLNNQLVTGVAAALRRKADERPAAALDPYELDIQLAMLSHAYQAVDRYLGCGLLLLSRNDGLMRLGFASVKDYARQFLGMSGRSAQELRHISETLEALPLLRRAYKAGQLSKSKVRALLRAITPADEAVWLSRARGLTVRGLEEELKVFCAAKASLVTTLPVRMRASSPGQACAPTDEPAGSGQTCAVTEPSAAGQVGVPAGEPAASTERPKDWLCLWGEDVPGRKVQTLISWELSVRLDTALEMHRRMWQADLPFHHFLACASAEYLQKPEVFKSYAEAVASCEERAERDLAERAGVVERARRRQEAIEEATARWAHLQPVSCATVTPMLAEIGSDSTPRFVHLALVKAVRLRQRATVRLMELLAAFKSRDAWRVLRFDSMAHYARERLGMSSSKVKALLHLHERLAGLPLVREAFAQGDIHQTQAELLVSVAKRDTERAWLEVASRLVVLRLREVIDAALQQNGVDRLLEFLRFHARRAGVPLSAASEPGQMCTHGSSGSGPGQMCASGSSGSDPGQMCASGSSGSDPGQMCASGSSGSGPGQMCPPAPPSMRSILLAEIDPERCEHLLGAGPLPSLGDNQVPFSFWLPADLESIWLILQDVVAESYGPTPPVFFLLETIVESYLSDHAAEALESIRTHRIPERDGWHCQVPGCGSRRNLHVHHIVFRSQGGFDAPENKITLCEVHHQHGIHAGRILARGLAPDRLEWHLGVEAGEAAMLVEQCGFLVSTLANR